MRMPTRWLVTLVLLLLVGCASTEARTYSPDPETTLHYVVAWPDRKGPAPLWVFQPGDGTLRDAFDEGGTRLLAEQKLLGHGQ